jgi:hypothetical protein
MATHQCSACLKKTNEDYDGANPLPTGFVRATSECAAVGTGGTHNWVPTQQGKKKNSKLINKNKLPSFLCVFPLIIFLIVPLLQALKAQLSSQQGKSNS